jgi:simple sugar transport system substrate-binding protein
MKLNNLFKQILLTSLVALAPALGWAQTHKIFLVTHGVVSDPFWAVVKNGAEAAAKQTGTTVEYRSPEKFDMVAMAQLIDAAVASKPDALIVTIPDPDAVGRSIEAAVKAGIPVISINSGADVFQKLGVRMHIGQEEYGAGKAAGERMKAAGVKKGIVINHEVGNSGLDLRAKGFSDGLGQKADVVPVNGADQTAAQNAVAAYLQAHPDVDGILALGIGSAEPTLEALSSQGKSGKIKFGSFDLSTAVLQALAAKEMDFAIDQQQYLQGYLPVILLANYLKYGLLPAVDRIPTGPGFVTPENAKQVMDLKTKGIR